MKRKILSSLLFSLITAALFTQPAKAQKKDKIEIMFVGFDHLNQLSNGSAQSDVYSQKKQAELAKLNKHLLKYAPDMIMVEVEPNEQSSLDSLYHLYQSKQLKLSDIKEGRGETYQVGFTLGSQLGHNKIYGVDHYEATSQSLLSSGENIELFQNELKKLQATARPPKKLVQQDSMSLYDYIAFINKPEIVNMSHYLFYNLPAIVVNGEFSKTATNTVNIGTIDKEHIGAEYITLFYNRNLKIYSNILNAQHKSKNKRLMVIMGQTHVGVLQDLFENNPNYTIVSSMKYLKP